MIPFKPGKMTCWSLWGGDGASPARRPRWAVLCSNTEGSASKRSHCLMSLHNLSQKGCLRWEPHKIDMSRDCVQLAHNRAAEACQLFQCSQSGRRTKASSLVHSLLVSQQWRALANIGNRNTSWNLEELANIVPLWINTGSDDSCDNSLPILFPQPSQFYSGGW